MYRRLGISQLGQGLEILHTGFWKLYSMVRIQKCYIQVSGNYTVWSGSGSAMYRFLGIPQHGQDLEMPCTGFWEFQGDMELRLQQ